MQYTIYTLFFAGLMYLAITDAKQQSVPAAVSDSWAVMLALSALFIRPANLLVGICFIAGTGTFAYFTNGMGSADVLVIGATAWTFGGLVTLYSLLIACLCGISWGYYTHTNRLAFIPHLLVGTVLALSMMLVWPPL